MSRVAERLRKLERCAAVAEDTLLVIVQPYGFTDDGAVDAKLALLKSAGFLRSQAIRTFNIQDSGEVEGLTDGERQFLAGRRRNS